MGELYLNRYSMNLLDKPSVHQDNCVVCGRAASNNHHVIIKGMGGSKESHRIPTVPLCGNGNTSGCHKMAHDSRLFFRYTDRWQFCILPKTTEGKDRNIVYAHEHGNWYDFLNEWSY